VIAVADVSGKGIAAALLMSVVQASLRVISGDRDISLSQLAEKMNRFLYRSSGASSMRHFLRADRRGRPTAAVCQCQCEEVDLALLSGDLMVAFTDGVPEALNADGEEFGEERLKRSCWRRVAVERSSVRIFDQVRDWIGDAEQHDDVTIVVKKV
jgi:phosphoserine phosphatase RsbU/P